MKKHRFLKVALLALPMLFFSFLSFAQSLTVNGTIKDESGSPMPGVTVVVKGSTQGTITDIDGLYSIKVQDSKSSLTFSFVGMETQVIEIAGRSNINVTMKTTASDLSEVVVIGYGTQKKSDITGAVSSVRPDALKNLATTDAAAALQGKASGVQILTNSGAPGEGAKIRVRGYSSNSGEIGPLLIVDGLKVDNIQYLNPSMIESVEILKDAASAAIYGAAAGNGVVLITTKSGTKGSSSISYDMSYSNQRLAKTPEIFKAAEFIEYKRMSGTTIDADLKTNKYDGTDTDWFDEVFDPSWASQHTITFQGGNDQGHYLTAISYYNNNGIVKGDKDIYKRLTAQINGDYNVKKWLQIGSNNSIEKWSTKSVSQMSAYGSVMNSVLTIDPLTPVYYSSPDQFAPSMKQGYDQGKMVLKNPENGLYYATSKYITDDNGNPLLQRDRIDRENGGLSLRGVLYGNLKPVNGLVITSRFGYRIAQSNMHSYNTPYWASSMANTNDYNLQSQAHTSLYYQWENFANYNVTIADKHDFTAMAGMSYQEDKNDNINVTVTGPDILTGYEPNFRYLDYVKSNMVGGTEKTTKTITNKPGLSTSIAYFGRLIYSYDNRYSIQANFRADAFDSSKLSKKARWGYFPSFSAGWTVSNEGFFKNNLTSDIISFMKLRGSWGQNGNINVLSDYKYSSTIAFNDSWYQYGVDDPAPSYGSHPSGLPNPNLKWETSTQLNIGLDMRFLNERLSLSAEYYNKTTDDLIVKMKPTPEVGFAEATINAGSVVNNGLEFEASWKDKIGDFSYSIGGNFSTLHNEVTYLDPSIPRLDGAKGGVDGTNNPVHTSFQVGKPIWFFRGYKYEGVDPETGKPIIKDMPNEKTGEPDGVISDADMTYIGKAIPDFTYGVTINLAYKGLDLNMSGSGVSGNDIFTVLYRADTPMRNSLKYYYDNAWTPTNKNASMPDPKAVAGDWNFWGSNASMFSGAYFKIKQIQLGYTVPEKIIKKVLINRLRCYVSLDDFFTFSKYPGCDPETATVSTAPERAGFDAGTYPTSKKVTFGLNVTF